MQKLEINRFFSVCVLRLWLTVRRARKRKVRLPTVHAGVRVQKRVQVCADASCFLNLKYYFKVPLIMAF